MKKILLILIAIAGLSIIIFATLFKRVEPTCICTTAGSCHPCTHESLWHKLKGEQKQSAVPEVQPLALEATVQEFYFLLSEKKYTEAIPLYDGLYDTLQNWNPEVSKNDYVTLWQNACEHNGLNCLPVLEIVSKTEKPLQEVFRPDDMLAEWRDKGTTYSKVYELTVRYKKPDGNPFVIGPCCGAPDTGERTREFIVRVGEKDGRYFVLDMPPYTP